MGRTQASFGATSLASAGLALSAALAVSASRHEAPTWLLPSLVAVAFFVPIRHVAPRVANALERVAWVLVAAAGLFGAAWSLYPVFPEALLRGVSMAVGYGLVLMAALFLAGRSVWSVGRTLIPAVAGALVAAAWDTTARIGIAVALAGASAFLLLAADDDGHADLRRVGRAVAVGLPALALALGIVRLLPWAQPLVEAAVAGSMDSSGGTSGFSLNSELGSVDELTLSQRVLMHVFTTKAQKLRAAVFVRFDGRGWRPASATGHELAPAPALPAGTLTEWLGLVPGEDFLVAPPAAHTVQQGARTRIVEIAPVAGALPAPAHPWLVRRARSVSTDAFGVLGPAGSGPETYAVVSDPADVDSQVGTEAAPPEGAEERAVSADTDPRLRALAGRLAGASDAPARRLALTVAFVQNECHYSLKPGAFRTRQPVAEFLFEKKRGYCEYFASAAALLLRLQGVPARYVRGFTVREANRLDDEYVVREADAHAWVEAYLPGRGWTEADPTPAAEYEAAHGSIERGGLRPLLAWLAARVAEVRAYLSAGDLAASARRVASVLASLRSSMGRHPRLVVLVILAAAGAWATRRGLWRRRLRRRTGARIPDGPGAEVLALMAEVDAFWARHGQPRPAHRTPREQLAALQAMSLPPRLWEAAREAVDVYYRGRFAGVAPLPDDLRRARAPLARSSRHSSSRTRPVASS